MHEPRDEFYVGYLPMPAGFLRFIRIAVPSLLWVMVLAAAAVALSQRSPGNAVWEDGQPVERIGTLFERPYPHIVDGPSVVFLVEQGKRGTQERAKGLDGAHVRVKGWKLERDGRQILELVPEADALRADPGTPASQVQSRSLGMATLRGEIIDYKCYLGAMKPGDGKAHKACAILCMSGGIPAMLVTREAGEAVYTLLADPAGGPVAQNIIELAGEPVEVSGELVEVGPVRVLKVQRAARR